MIEPVPLPPDLLTDLPRVGRRSDAHTLWFAAPAHEFTEALPLGNGSLGAMCYGGVPGAKISLNEATAWSGAPADPAAMPAEGPAHIARARTRLLAGDHHGAEAELAHLGGGYTQSFLPFAELLLSVGGHDPAAAATGYSRVLDLRQALHEHSYHLGERLVTQWAYVSAAHQLLVVELRVSGPALEEVRLAASSQLRHQVQGGDGALRLELTLPTDVAPTHAQPPRGVRYEQPERPSLHGALALRWQHDGQEHATADALTATHVTRLRLLVSTGTTYAGPAGPLTDPAALRERTERSVADAARLPSDELLAAHVATHRALYDRVELSLGDEPEQAPLDQWLRRAPADPQLAALLFHYGRYLLISSSRPGTLAATLQGLWNESLQPPWSSNYTLNINTQMNYWAAEGANLAECHEPLFDLVQALATAGRHTARTLYGLDGWVAHHNTDAWAFTTPVDGDAAWAFWPLGGAWLATHLWEHVRHGAGDDFARHRAWPVVQGAAEFLLGWWQPQPDGTLGTLPSTSPENVFHTATGRPAAATASSTADIAITARLFRAAVELAPPGHPLLPRLHTALSRLPAIPLAADGSVQEWAQPHHAVDGHHRHVSHLIFAFPGEHELSAPLRAAVATTLAARGDDSTGWSLVWKMALQARLRDRLAVDRLLRLVFRSADATRGPFAGGLYPNLFAAHPPFQIDGNLGYVAAVLECLLHSHAGELELLPAVPHQWPTGRVRGLVARPGLFVELHWDSPAGRLTLCSARLRARHAGTAGPLTVRWGQRRTTVTVTADAWLVLGPADFN